MVEFNPGKKNSRLASGFGGKKQTEALFFIAEEIVCAVGSASELFALNKIDNERRYPRSGDKKIIGRVLVGRYFLSQCQGGFDDKAANPFQQDDNGRKLRKSRRMFVAPDFRFGQDVKIFLCG